MTGDKGNQPSPPIGHLLPVAYQRLLPNGRIQEVNSPWLALTGYARAQVVGKRFSDLLDAHSAGRFQEAFDRTLRRGTGGTGETEVAVRGVPDRVFAVAWVVETSARNEPLSIHCVLRDITESKRAEREAYAWQATFDAVSDPIWILDATFTIEQANKATKAFFGLSREEVIGRRCWEIVHATKAPPAACPVHKVQETLQRHWAEIVEDGRCLHVLGDALLDAEGRYTGAVHIITDVTRQKRDELRLRETARHLMEVQRVARVGSWVWRRGVRGLECSDEMARLWGFSPGTRTLKRQRMMRRIHPEDRRSLLMAVGRAVATGERVPLTVRIVHPDATQRYLEGVVYAELDDRGNPLVLRGVVRDVTEHRETEVTLRKRLAYQRLIAEISEFALNIEELDRFLRSCLERTGNVLGVDRVRLFEYDETTKSSTKRFEWVGPGIPCGTATVEPLRVADFPWWHERLQQGTVLSFSDVSRIPTDEARALLREEQILSLLAVPLLVHGKFYGHLSFNACRERRDWPPEEVSFLQAVGRIMAATIERRSVQDALRKSEEQYRRLAETSRDVILTHDMSGVITYINRAGLELTGRLREEVLGREVTLLIPDAPDIERDVLGATSGDEGTAPTLHETRLISGAGDRIPVEAFVSAISHDGVQDGVLIVARDIRERKRAQAERELLYNQLAQARKMESIGR